MFYRIWMMTAFTEEDAANDIWDKVKDHWDKALTLNKDKPNQEKSFISIERCHHEEEPVKSCELIKRLYSD